MFNILTLNKISASGLANFDKELFACADNFDAPDAIIVRSASMHETEFSSKYLLTASLTALFATECAYAENASSKGT